MSRFEQIKKALEGVTPGPWELCAHLKHNDACSCGYRGVIYGPESDGYAICQPGHEPAPEGQEGTEPPRYPRDVEIANMRYISAVNPVAVSELITSLEALQRENERLQAEIYRKSSMPGDHRYWEGRYRDEAAENERLRNKVDARALTDQQLADEIAAVSKACEGGFGEGGGSPGEWWYERADELEHERKRRELERQLQQHNSRTALATAGEHHAE